MRAAISSSIMTGQLLPVLGWAFCFLDKRWIDEHEEMRYNIYTTA